jgi:transcriptional regulator with XRE-family HTH domain
MTPDQYKAALARLGWTQAQAAEALGVSLRSSSAYATGSKIPNPVQKLLTKFLQDADREAVVVEELETIIKLLDEKLLNEMDDQAHSPESGNSIPSIPAP